MNQKEIEIIKLYETNHFPPSQADIGRQVGCTREYVRQTINKYLKKKKSLLKAKLSK